MTEHGFEYDLVVIGGGSGGLACSKEAAKLGAKVACLDFVDPTPLGTTWGLGGTCVNVGCIPKKLMHQAGILGESFSDARAFGWKLQSDGIDWNKMVQGIQDHIGGLNFGYRVSLRDNKVTYINAKGKFTGPHTITATSRNGQVKEITSQRFVVAVGGRPRYLGVPGDTECCLTSDDIFSLDHPPGKTLCVGASYISLETAGFLTALGYDTTVMARSIFLRGFDQEIAGMIAGHMERHGTKFLKELTPTKFEKTEDGRVKVTYKSTQWGFEAEGLFDTVVLAVGRDACTRDLGLDSAGVEVVAATGKIPVTDEQTNVENIYALGDVLESRQELTPVAIKAGIRLARRLYGGGTLTMDYDEVPTTVFTPMEYGCVGLSEEAAKEKYGEDNVEVYMLLSTPLEWATNHEQHDGQLHREENICYFKMITHIPEKERVIGLHYLGPNAGEIIQGFAVAVKMGATKSDFDNTVGIHPTLAETFTTMDITKRSGANAKSRGC